MTNFLITGWRSQVKITAWTARTSPYVGGQPCYNTNLAIWANSKPCDPTWKKSCKRWWISTDSYFVAKKKWWWFKTKNMTKNYRSIKCNLSYSLMNTPQWWWNDDIFFCSVSSTTNQEDQKNRANLNYYLVASKTAVGSSWLQKKNRKEEDDKMYYSTTKK